jgi:Asp-tRNA(Asn)/Glu-tRNA(Gln) amidotransferase A subunit family amidase
MWAGLVCEHVVTRSVRDSAAMLDCLAGPAPGDPYFTPPPQRPFLASIAQDPPSLRIALLTETFGGEAIDPACRAAVLSIAALLEELRHSVEPASPAFDVAAYGQAHATILCANLAAFMETAERQLGRKADPDTLEPMTQWVLEEGRRRSAIDLVRAQDELNMTSRRMAEFFGNYDILLTPTLATPPVEIGHLFGDEDGAELRRRTLAFAPFTHVFNGTGQPAVSLPASWDACDLPIGVQLVARFAEDTLLLQLCAQIERARPWNRHRPGKIQR